MQLQWESNKAAFPTVLHQQAFLVHTTPALLITRSIYFSSKCSQHLYTFKPYYCSKQCLKQPVPNCFPYFLLPASASHGSAMCSHATSPAVLVNCAPSTCSSMGCSELFYWCYVLTVSLKGLLLAGFVQSCLIGFKLLCVLTQCQAQALNPCQVIRHFSLDAIDRVTLLACWIKD